MTSADSRRLGSLEVFVVDSLVDRSGKDERSVDSSRKWHTGVWGPWSILCAYDRGDMVDLTRSLAHNIDRAEQQRDSTVGRG